MQRTAPSWKTRSLFGCLPLRRSLALLCRRLLRTGETKLSKVIICRAGSHQKLKDLPFCLLLACLPCESYTCAASELVVRGQTVRAQSDCLSPAAAISLPLFPLAKTHTIAVLATTCAIVLYSLTCKPVACDLQWPRPLWAWSSHMSVQLSFATSPRSACRGTKLSSFLQKVWPPQICLAQSQLVAHTACVTMHPQATQWPFSSNSALSVELLYQ